ncbi:MAG: response regulator transcription factor FixJ [Xanthobacteraceae bacterium]|nr:response regulator transcription factor FixJ [Xanthobacteraceae bacterium]
MPVNEIFVIDDDPAMRDSLAFLLQSAGYSVRLFESAQTFLEESPAPEGCCILTDIRMPGIDGIELLRKLNATPHMAQSHVIVMTGHGDIPLAVEAMKLGAVDFLEKPFDDERLISAIKSVFSQGTEKSKQDLVTGEIVGRINSLSQRERQVMEGLVAGLSNKLIAREYDISPRTVEVYRANVMTKMQANNISELVRQAIKGGMIES